MIEYTQDNIEQLIPQRRPIIMIDGVKIVSETSAIASLTIHSDNWFIHHNRLLEAGLVEHAAQSAAALLGARNYHTGKPAQIGYIGEIKNFEVKTLPVLGDKLITYIEMLAEVDNISLLEVRSEANGERVCAGQIKVVVIGE